MSAILSNHYKYQIGISTINLGSDSIKVLLMRSGFVFNASNHGVLANIKADSTAITINANATAGTFTRSTGSFLDDGFVPGNQITGSGFANAGNNAVFIISTVTATIITAVSNTGMVTETGGGNEQLIADDELASGSGYVKNTKTTGTVTGLQDDSLNRATWTFPTVTWDAVGGSIGPSPCLILYSDTSADNTIIGALVFADEKTATDGSPFEYANGSIIHV